MRESLPRGWISVTLRELVQPSRETVQARANGGRYLGLEHVEPHTTRISGTADSSGIKGTGVRFRAGDTLYARLRPYLNKTCVPDFEGVASGEFIVFPAVQWLTPRFLMFFLHQPDVVAFANARSTGTHRPRVKWDDLAAFPIGLPPLAEQRRIVAAIEEQFSRIDAGVEALRRARRNLHRMRAAVLHAAVTGRLVPQDPGDEPAELFVERVLEERRANWNGGRYREPVAPDLRDLPALPPGWTWATLEQVSMRVTVGHVGPMKNEYVADGVPFLRSQNVREHRFDPNGLVYISREFHERLSKSRLQPGDLVIVRSGSVGTTCVVPETLPEANCADLVVVQRPLGIDPRFGAYYMNSLARQYVHSEQVGVALTHFNTRSAASLPIPVPPLSEQARIVEAVERFLSVVSDMEITVDAANLRERRLRQSILTSAFAGRLVPQDPSDEPASALLDRIRIARATKDSKPSPLPGRMHR